MSNDGDHPVELFGVRYLGDRRRFDGVVLVAFDQDELSSMRRRIRNDTTWHQVGTRIGVWLAAVAGMGDLIFQVAHR